MKTALYIIGGLVLLYIIIRVAHNNGVLKGVVATKAAIDMQTTPAVNPSDSGTQPVPGGSGSVYSLLFAGQMRDFTNRINSVKLL